MLQGHIVRVTVIDATGFHTVVTGQKLYGWTQVENKVGGVGQGPWPGQRWTAA
jgi:hypothetical protein